MNKGLAFSICLLFSLCSLILERFLFNGIGNKPLYVSYTISYILYLAVAFFLSKFFRRLNPYFKLFILFLPQLAFSIFVFLDKDLYFRIPSIYPASTILIFCGIFSGFIIYTRKVKSSFAIILLSVIFIFGYYNFVTIPFLLKEASNPISNKKISIKNHILYTKDSLKFDMQSFNGKTVFVEFWFKDCVPCVVKMPSLNSLKEKLKNDTNIVFINVNAGNIDSYATFKKVIENIEYVKFVNLYDSEGLFAKEFKIDSYPVDVVLRNGEVIRIFKGWYIDMAKKYLLETEALLKNNQ